MGWSLDFHFARKKLRSGCRNYLMCASIILEALYNVFWGPLIEDQG